MATLENMTMELLGEYPDAIYDAEGIEVVNAGDGGEICDGEYTAVLGQQKIHMVYEDGTLKLNKEIFKMLGKWKNLEAEMQYKTSELGNKILKKLEELKNELQSHGMWDYAWVCRLELYDDGDSTGYGDQEAVLYWYKDTGYCVRYFECKHGGQWEEIENSFEIKIEKIDLQTLKRNHLMLIAQELPRRIKELTELYMEEINGVGSAIKNLN